MITSAKLAPEEEEEEEEEEEGKEIMAPFCDGSLTAAAGVETIGASTRNMTSSVLLILLQQQLLLLLPGLPPPLPLTVISIVSDAPTHRTLQTNITKLKSVLLSLYM